jgi:hypothetical protein
MAGGAVRPERLKGTKPTVDLIDAATGEVIVEAGDKITPRKLRKLAEEGVKETCGSKPFDDLSAASPRRHVNIHRPKSMSRPATS